MQESLARAGRIALFVGVPLLALVAVDRALVAWTPLWRWLAQELPRRVDDPCRVEALLRSLPRGREHVVVLGNSRADDALDLGVLQRRFASQGLRFHNLTVAGSGVVEQAMLAPRIAELEPRAALFMLHPSALRNGDIERETLSYDVATALQVFTLRELASSTGFHLTGLAGQLHVLARDRACLQSAALVRAGRTSFAEVRRERLRRIRAAERRDRRAHVLWLRDPPGPPSDNPNLRAIDQLANTLDAAGVKLIVLEAPSHPSSAPAEARPRFDAFRADLDERALRLGFAFVPTTRFPSFGADAFVDHIHASPSGRRRYTERLAAELTPLLAD